MKNITIVVIMILCGSMMPTAVFAKADTTEVATVEAANTSPTTTTESAIGLDEYGYPLTMIPTPGEVLDSALAAQDVLEPLANDVYRVRNRYMREREIDSLLEYLYGDEELPAFDGSVGEFASVWYVKDVLNRVKAILIPEFAENRLTQPIRPEDWEELAPSVQDPIMLYHPEGIVMDYQSVIKTMREFDVVLHRIGIPSDWSGYATDRDLLEAVQAELPEWEPSESVLVNYGRTNQMYPIYDYLPSGVVGASNLFKEATMEVLNWSYEEIEASYKTGFDWTFDLPMTHVARMRRASIPVMTSSEMKEAVTKFADFIRGQQTSEMTTTPAAIAVDVDTTLNDPAEPAESTEPKKASVEPAEPIAEQTTSSGIVVQEPVEVVDPTGVAEATEISESQPVAPVESEQAAPEGLVVCTPEDVGIDWSWSDGSKGGEVCDIATVQDDDGAEEAHAPRPGSAAWCKPSARATRAAVAEIAATWSVVGLHLADDSLIIEMESPMYDASIGSAYTAVSLPVPAWMQTAVQEFCDLFNGC